MLPGSDPITAPIVVAGGGVAGLASGLGLARAGQQVVVVERDPLSAPDHPDDAFGLERPGAPQVRHTHGLLAQLTTTMRDRFPDVLDDLVAAGGVEVDLAGRFGDYQEGDEQLRVLLARRTSLEWALRRAAVAQPGLVLRDRSPIAGLAGGDGVVEGVRLASGEVLPASSVVLAGGRRPDVPGWLRPLGIEIPEEEHDTGIVYLTRWYRTDDGWDRTMGDEELIKLGGDLGYLFYLAVPADRGTFSLTMAVGAEDRALRSGLTDPDAFGRAVAALPLPPGLLDRLEPTGPVHLMAGLVNRIRRFTAADGRPLAPAVHAVGDAHTCTNPIYGRGCSLALVQAAALADAFAAHPGDPCARAEAYEKVSAERVEPWYHLSVQTDRARQQAAGEGGGPSPLDQLFRLGGSDPLVGRAILRVINLLTTPQEVLADPLVLARVGELAAAGPGPERSRWRRSGPSHQDMIEMTTS